MITFFYFGNHLPSIEDVTVPDSFSRVAATAAATATIITSFSNN
jgi:hypothetical protein